MRGRAFFFFFAVGCFSAPAGANINSAAIAAIRQKCAQIDAMGKNMTRRVMEMPSERATSNQRTALLVRGQTRKLWFMYSDKKSRTFHTMYLENGRLLKATQNWVSFSPGGNALPSRGEENLYFQNGRLIQWDSLSTALTSEVVSGRIKNAEKRRSYYASASSFNERRLWKQKTESWHSAVAQYERELKIEARRRRT